MALGEELQSALKIEVKDTPEVLEKYSRDASLFMLRPEVVVYPKNAAEVGKIVQFVSAKKKESPKSRISITPRAAGTDMSGGPLTDSIVLDTVTYLHKLLSIESMSATVEPGMYFRDFDKETKKKNLELPEGLDKTIKDLLESKKPK